MAEIGVASSIIAVLNLSGQVTILSYEYLAQVKRSSKEIRELIDELDSLQAILKIFETQIRKNPDSLAPAVQTLCVENGPLEGCLKDLSALKETLTPKGGVREIFERLKWPIRDGEINAIKARLERHKTLFLLALAVDQMSAVAVAGKKIKEE